VRLRRYLPAAATSLLIAAAIAGCGPLGDDEESDGGGALGGSEFVQRGDEICRSAQQQVAEVQRDPPGTREESARFAESLIAIFEDEVARLEALEPPEDARAAFDRYLDARTEAIGFLRDGLAAAQGNDPEGYADAQADVAAGQVKRSQLARQVGFSDCSRPLTGGGRPAG
jgi:hypothetical protein